MKPKKTTKEHYQTLLNALALASQELARSLDRPERAEYWFAEFRAIQWELWAFHRNYDPSQPELPDDLAESIIADWESELG